MNGRLAPVKRRVLIKRFRREFGFEGPRPGGNHSYMVRGKLKVRIPNEHRKDVWVGQLQQILEDAGISREEWQKQG